MNTNSSHGMIAAMIFLVLSGIAIIILIIALIISIVRKFSNRQSLLTQRSFGYVAGAAFLLLTNILSLYILVSIDNEALREAFDSFISYIIMVITLACMLYISKQWKRKSITTSA